MKIVIKISWSIMFIFSVCSFGCTRQNENAIESIDVLFYNCTYKNTYFLLDYYDMKTELPAIYKSAVYNEEGDSVGIKFKVRRVLNLTLTDPSVIQNITNELNNLKPSELTNYDVDARISCTIKYKNGKKERLNIGGFKTDSIEYCGIPQKQNNKLLYLIKKNIDYYLWMDDYILKDFVELHDLSFKRDSVIGRSGRKF